MNTARRFAAILATDVVGYARLMGDHSVRLTSTPAVRLSATNVSSGSDSGPLAPEARPEWFVSGSLVSEEP
jgi:hypothetical protein